jgi:hypothetical protein
MTSKKYDVMRTLKKLDENICNINFNRELTVIDNEILDAVSREIKKL